MIELLRALGAVVEAPAPQHQNLWRALGLPCPPTSDYTELFDFQLFPYASVYLGPEGKIGGDARDRITDFLRVLHIEPGAEADHLADMLAIYARLVELERQDNGETKSPWYKARSTMFVEHLVSWIPLYTNRVVDLGGPCYRAWATLLDAVIQRAARHTPELLSQLSTHLTNSPGLSDPRTADPEEFLNGLFAPARTGIILTTSDLGRAANQLGLNRRIGERRTVLRSMLQQDPAAVLSWLSTTAVKASTEWATHWLAATPTGTWWRERSASTGALLSELAIDAAHHETMTCDR